jgi:hemimethylated DNA binding protein
MVYSTEDDKSANRQISDRPDRPPPDILFPWRDLRYRSGIQQYRGMVAVDSRGMRPHKDQPFYHLLAENSESEYVAYVSEQNLLPDESGEPIRHSQVAEIFIKDKSGSYRPRNPSLN